MQKHLAKKSYQAFIVANVEEASNVVPGKIRDEIVVDRSAIEPVEDACRVIGAVTPDALICLCCQPYYSLLLQCFLSAGV